MILHTRWQLNDLARLLDKWPGLAAVSEAIEGLPEEEREVFKLVRIQGLTYAEAAAVVGVSVKTVGRRLNRARLLLAEELADLCPGGSLPSPGDTSTS